MSDYAELKARLYRWELVWGYLPSIAPHFETVPGMTTGVVIMDTQEAAAAIDALERERERFWRANLALQKSRDAAEARMKRLEEALHAIAADEIYPPGFDRDPEPSRCAKIARAALHEDKSHE